MFTLLRANLWPCSSPVDVVIYDDRQPHGSAYSHTCIRTRSNLQCFQITTSPTVWRPPPTSGDFRDAMHRLWLTSAFFWYSRKTPVWYPNLAGHRIAADKQGRCACMSYYVVLGQIMLESRTLGSAYLQVPWLLLPHALALSSLRTPTRMHRATRHIYSPPPLMCPLTPGAVRQHILHPIQAPKKDPDRTIVSKIPRFCE